MNSNGTSAGQVNRPGYSLKDEVAEKKFIFLVLFAVQVFFAYTLYPELAIDIPDTNDNVFHFSLITTR